MDALPAAVHHRLVEALARRAQAHQGAARQLIEARLAQLRRVPAAEAEREAAPPPAAPPPGPLALLVAQFARAGTAEAPGADELRAVREHRGTWQRLGLAQRLSQSLAQVPGNAGPLNSQRLLHQVLRTMLEASPDYLQHFMAHVEGLMALEPGPAPPAPGAPPAQPRRSKRSIARDT